MDSERSIAPPEEAPARAFLRAGQRTGWLRAAWSLPARGVAFLLGPIFERELRVNGRKSLTYVARALVAALTGGVFLLALLETVDSGSPSAASRLQELQSIVPSISIMMIWIMFALLMLVGPTLTGSSISDERRARTLATLLTTPVTARQIVLGKLAGKSFELVLLALMVAPALLALRVFGGVDTVALLLMLAIVVVTSVQASAMALLLSIWNKRSFGAIGGGLVFVACVHFLVQLVYFISLAAGGTGGSLSTDIVISSSSIFCLIALTSLMFGGGGMPTESPPEILSLMHLGYSVATTVAIILVAIASLRRAMRREAEGGDVVTEASKSTRGRGASRSRRSKSDGRRDLASDGASGAGTLEALKGRAEDPGLQPKRADDGATGAASAGEATVGVSREEIRESTRSREVGDRPVLWRELSTPLFSKRWYGIVIALVLTAGLTWMASEVGLLEEGLYGITAALGLLTVLAHAALASTGAVAGERDAQTWQVLLTTPLSAREIILGKFFGAMRRLWYVPSLTLGALVVLSLVGNVLHPIVIATWVLVSFGGAVFLVAGGIFWSLVLRRPTTVAATNMFVAFSIWLGLPILCVAIEPLRRFTGTFLLDLPIIGNPMVLVVSSIEGGVTDRDWWSEPRLSFELPAPTGDIDLSGVQFLLVVIGACVAHCLLAIGALTLSIRNFNRLGGRSS